MGQDVNEMPIESMHCILLIPFAAPLSPQPTTWVGLKFDLRLQERPGIGTRESKGTRRVTVLLDGEDVRYEQSSLP